MGGGYTIIVDTITKYFYNYLYRYRRNKSEKHKAKLKNSPQLLTIGVDDNYIQAGSYNFLKEKYGLTANKIISNIVQNLNS